MISASHRGSGPFRLPSLPRLGRWRCLLHCWLHMHSTAGQTAVLSWQARRAAVSCFGGQYCMVSWAPCEGKGCTFGSSLRSRGALMIVWGAGDLGFASSYT